MISPVPSVWSMSSVYVNYLSNNPPIKRHRYVSEKHVVTRLESFVTERYRN